MAKFIRDSEINSAIEKIIENATESIFLVSPYIKLHSRIEEKLRSKHASPAIEIRVLFGKNVDNPSMSLRAEDLDLFKEFHNVEIRFNERLHAKYYSNELDGLLTSMNLHVHSANNNIEFGILLNSPILGSIDSDASTYFTEVFNSSKLIYKRVANFEKTNMGLSKKFKDSTIEIDNTEAFFQKKGTGFTSSPNPIAPTKKLVEKVKEGFCIRTGKPIPFNPQKPFTDDALASWSKFKNPTFAEKYCHFSGEPSNGETTFDKPILRKNWSKAKAEHGF